MNKNFLLALVLAAVWTIPWKGLALWKAARRGEKIWFIVMLLVNTMAILEILYVFVIRRSSKDDQLQVDISERGNYNQQA